MASKFLEVVWEKGEVKERVADYLAALEYPEPAVIRTAELCSWKLYRTPRWELALNQFRPFANGRQASENIHNHSRPFASLTVSGGYEQDYYRLLKPACEFVDGEPWAGGIEKLPGPTTTPGMVYVTDTDVFHAIARFEPGTLSLVVYGSMEQTCIVCLNQLTGLVERRRKATVTKNALVAELREK
jgi:hypothetical protein